jgi:hypothetical protein
MITLRRSFNRNFDVDRYLDQQLHHGRGVTSTLLTPKQCAAGARLALADEQPKVFREEFRFTLLCGELATEFTVHWSYDLERFIARAVELPGCTGFGRTEATALAMCKRNVRNWLSARGQRGCFGQFHDRCRRLSDKLEHKLDSIDWMRMDIWAGTVAGVILLNVLAYLGYVVAVAWSTGAIERLGR